MARAALVQSRSVPAAGDNLLTRLTTVLTATDDNMLWEHVLKALVSVWAGVGGCIRCHCVCSDRSNSIVSPLSHAAECAIILDFFVCSEMVVLNPIERANIVLLTTQKQFAIDQNCLACSATSPSSLVFNRDRVESGHQRDVTPTSAVEFQFSFFFSNEMITCFCL